MTLPRPETDEYAPFYAGYVAGLSTDDILDTLDEQCRWLDVLPRIVPPEREEYRYAPGKWSIRQLIGHLADAERVFGYRAMCISRGETASLPGFDENTYVEAAASDRRSLNTLVEELAALRRANLLLFRHLPPGTSGNRGNANGSTISVRALAWIIAGHFRHHTTVLADRYGVGGSPPEAGASATRSDD